MSNILEDKSKSGKDRHWRERKIASQNLAEAYRDVWYRDLYEQGWTDDEISQFLPEEYRQGYWKYYRKTDKCGNILTFVRLADGRLKLYQAWFCKDRICALCNWRRALKFSVQVSQLLKALQARNIEGWPIMSTHTLKNVPGDLISDTISHISRSFTKLMQYKAFAPYVIGTIRTVELTYNAETDTWHIHIHCLIWMTYAYYKIGYVDQKEWRRLWAKAAKLDYDPWVHVQTVKARKPSPNDPTGLYKAVLEVCKYPVKPDAYIKLTDPPANETPEEKDKRLKRIKELRDGLRNKRLISFSGLLKKLRAELQLDDIEDGDLVQTGEDEDKDEVVNVIVAEWDKERRNYYTHAEQMKKEYLPDWHVERG